MQIFVNGEPKDVEPGTTIAALVASLGLGAGPVAVERNRDVVPRAEHATTTLAEDDRLEVVHFVGGG
jgi:sulfur carrier protein